MKKTIPMRSLLLATFIVTAAWTSVYSQQGVRLTMRGVQYHDNDTINIMDVGENGAALVCQTDLSPCCRSFRAGEWYYPNGTAVPIEGEGRDFYRNRGDDGTVRLNRRNNALYPIGIYHCEIPDHRDINQSLHIGLLTYSHFVDLSYGSNNSTLTCVTTGAPATSVYGECVSNDCLRLPVKKTVDSVRHLYNTTVNVSQRTSSYYVCITKEADRTSYATFLTKSRRGERSYQSSSQFVGRTGEQLTLLCLADEQIEGVAWTTGTTNNITFTHLSSTDAGVYTCSGTTLNNGMVSHSVKLTVSECGAIVWITSVETTAIFGRDHLLTCNTHLWGTGCTTIDYFICHDGQPKSTNNTIRFRPLKLSDAGYYTCTVTVNGHNFTSHPTFNPFYTQIPTPEVIASSNLENPVPPGSIPTLTCTIRLNSSVDSDVKITVSWRGPVFGFGKFIMTEPVVNSSAKVPTYMSSAFLNAEGTFYDSGLYHCSAKVSPVRYQDYIHNSSTSNQSISVLFQYPRRPHLHTINQVGEDWIYVSWNQNSNDNISNYEVNYSYIGECAGVNQTITTRIISDDSSSYNITGLGGEYFNYSINLTAINATGRSPPNIAYALTKSAAPSGAPKTFTSNSTLINSTNVTVQWGRVHCRDRNSEISHYTLRYSLADGSEGGQREVNVTGVGDSERIYTVTRLNPDSSHTLTIAAVNTDNQSGPSISINVTTAPPESVAIQLQLIGVHNCLQWRISDPVIKVYDVSEGIANGVNQHCPHCELEPNDIRNGEFQCFSGSPNQVTFRGKIQDRAQATAREVISYIEQWITSADVVNIPVHHARLNINSTCVVLLASLDDLECPGILMISTTIGDIDTSIPPSATAPDVTERTFSTAVILPQSHSDAGAIVGGAVAIVFIVTAGIVTVFLSRTILKHFLSTNSTPSAPPKGATYNKNITDTEESNQVFVEMDANFHNKHYEPLQLPCDVAASDDVHEENKGDENYYDVV